MSSSDPTPDPFTAPDRQALLQIARDSIEHGLEARQPLTVDPAQHSPALREVKASFVTLNRDGKLRGCIGSLQAVRPLAEDVSHNAFAAAFKDPRFAPLSHEEFTDLDIHLSVLSTPQPMQFNSQEDLLTQLRPSVDGLILEEGPFRGTFLPSVWQQIPEPAQFLSRLKIKARLPENYWSPMIRVWRYSATSIP